MKREIMAKTLVGKGRLQLQDVKTVHLEEKITKTLGCWIINNTYETIENQHAVGVKGHYDIQLWYAYENDQKTNVYNETVPFSGVFQMARKKIWKPDEETFFKIHVMRYPSAVKMEIVGEHDVKITVESLYFIDSFQPAILQIETLEPEDDTENIDEEIVMNVNTNYLTDGH